LFPVAGFLLLVCFLWMRIFGVRLTRSAVWERVLMVGIKMMLFCGFSFYKGGKKIVDVNELIRTISLIVAPAVMISCCTIFLNGQLQRYDNIGARMRLMNQERFEMLRLLKEMADAGNTTLEDDVVESMEQLRISEIEAQLPHLLRRYKLIHDAALVVGIAILLNVVCMFIIALAVVLHSNLIATFALLVFLLGMLTVFVGGVVIMLEIYKSHLSVRYEVLHSLSLGKRNPTLTLPHMVVRIPGFPEQSSSQI